MEKVALFRLKYFYPVFFLLLLSLSNAALATPITTTTASYSVSPSFTGGDIATTAASVNYSNGAYYNGTATAQGTSSAIVSASGGIFANSAYENGIGMNYENYISPDEVLPFSPTAENVSFNSTSTWQETYVASTNADYSWLTNVPTATIHMWYDTFNNHLPVSFDLTAGFEGIITANGSEVQRFSSKSSFTEGGGFSATHEGMSGGNVNSHAGDPKFLEFTETWNSFNLNVDLGSFSADELITIGLSVSTFINGTGLQNGAEVFFGDSGDLSGNGNGVSGHLTPASAIYVPSAPSPDPVPEPSTIFLLGSGLAGLAFYRSKRK